MKKLALFVAAIAAIPTLLGASVFADSPGQLSNGDANYQVKNVTTNGAYSKSVNLACSETVKYSILLANSDFGQLKDVTVKATLPGSISISGKNANNETTSVSGSVNVTIPSKATLQYVSGSTNYYVYNSDGSQKSSKTLADGVAVGGINTGTLDGSTQARVYFQAKVSCPTPETPKDNCPVPGKEHLPKDSPECKTTPPVTPPETPKTPETPSELPATGAADVIAKLAGVVALTGASVYYVASRRS
jgi:hypothetical protein